MTSASSPRRRPRTALWVVLGVVVVAVVVALLLRPAGPGAPQGQGGGETTSEAPTTTPTQPADCPDVQVVIVPGTYETSVGADPAVPAGLQAEVGTALTQRYDASRLTTYYVPYPAQFANPMPYEQSRQAGVAATDEALAATAARCPLTSYAITGFSQGASVAGDVATAIGNGEGPVPAERVVAVGLISDPYRQPGQVQMPGTPVDGTGIGGPRPQGFGALTERTVTFCAPGDLICDTPVDALAPQNLGATLAQLGSYISTNVHSSYGSYVVDDQGTTATQWLVGYVAQQVDATPPP